MKINTKNVEKIEEILNSINGKRKERIAELSTIDIMIEIVNTELANCGIANSNQMGTTIELIHAVKPAYKYNAHYTYIKLERGAFDWFMIDCSVQYARKNSKDGRSFRMSFSDKAIEQITNKLKNYRV